MKPMRQIPTSRMRKTKGFAEVKPAETFASVRKSGFCRLQGLRIEDFR